MNVMGDIVNRHEMHHAVSFRDDDFDTLAWQFQRKYHPQIKHTYHQRTSTGHNILVLTHDFPTP